MRLRASASLGSIPADTSSIASCPLARSSAALSCSISYWVVMVQTLAPLIGYVRGKGQSDRLCRPPCGSCNHAGPDAKCYICGDRVQRPRSARACHRIASPVQAVYAGTTCQRPHAGKMSSSFVAGASGAIGEPLTAELLKQGHSVVGMTTSEARARILERQGAEALIVDAFDAVALETALRRSKPDVVIDELTSLPKDPTDMPKYAAGDRKLRIEGGGICSVRRLRAACGAICSSRAASF